MVLNRSIRTQGIGMVSWEVIWIVRLVKVLRAFFQIPGVGQSLRLASNGIPVMVSIGHRQFILMRLMG